MEEENIVPDVVDTIPPNILEVSQTKLPIYYYYYFYNFYDDCKQQKNVGVLIFELY